MIKCHWLINLYLKMNIYFMGLTDLIKLHPNVRTRPFLMYHLVDFEFIGVIEIATPAIIVTVKM